MIKKLNRDGFEYYLEIEAAGGEEYEYQMLLANKIDYILPLNVITVNEQKRLIYSTSGYKTLDNSIEKMLIDGDQILCVMESALNGIDGVKKYLLMPNNLVLSPDCIFADPDYKRVGLIYVPGYDKDVIIQLRELMECLIGRINQSDMKSIMLAWKLYILMKDDHISLREIRKILDSYKGNLYEKEQDDYGQLEGRYDLTPRMPGEHKEKKHKKQSGKLQKKAAGKQEGRYMEKTKSTHSLPFLLCCVLVILLCLSQAFILCHIYARGILVWKRNFLLINTALLAVSVGGLIFLWKRERTLGILEKLRRQCEK